MEKEGLGLKEVRKSSCWCLWCIIESSISRALLSICLGGKIPAEFAERNSSHLGSPVLDPCKQLASLHLAMIHQA